MAFIPTPQGVEVVLKMTQQGVPVVNVWHVDLNSAVTVADLGVVGGTFDAWITSDLAALMSSTVSFDQLIVTDISVINGAQDIRVPTTSTGLAAGTPAAANAAVVVSQRTGLTGRSFRGRTYLGGITQTVQTTSHEVTVGFAAAVLTSFNNLIALLNIAGYALSVLSKIALGVSRVAGLLTEITTIIVNTTIDSQRRRTGN